MSADAANLLRLLGGVAGARFAGNSAQPRAIEGPAGFDFDALLAKATRGELRSGREIQLAEGLDGSPDAQTLKDLAEAADAAEAAGASKLLATIGSMQAVVDIATRTIIAYGPGSAQSVRTGIDAAVALPSPEGTNSGAVSGGASGPGIAGGAASAASLFGGRIDNRAVAELLAQIAGGAQRAD